MQENKRRTILAIILATTIIIGLVGTYAYFVTQGNTVKQNLTVEMGTLALTFGDNTDGFDAELNLGESASKEFIIRNTGTQPVTTKMYWKNLTNTYMKESLSYKLEYKTSENGTWQDVTTTSTNVPRSVQQNTKELANNLTIPVGGVYYYRLTIKLENLEGINQDTDKNAIMNSRFTIGNENVTYDPSEVTLRHLKLTSNGTKLSFVTLATTNEGVFEMADDYGTSYYYRGAVDNNYVKFGGFYWRIIRINGDGSIRMIYDGTKAHSNGETGDEDDRFIQTGQPWNANYDDAKYVGWMFGGNDGEASTIRIDNPNAEGYESTAATETIPAAINAVQNQTNSDIKDIVDQWYGENIVNNTTNNKDLSIYLGDEIFCNDRSFESRNTGTGFGTSETYYGARGRVGHGISNLKPSFACPNKNDAFTVLDTTKGNGSLTYPVGLITADEIIAAGAKYYQSDGTTNNISYYLHRNKWYWSLSPGNMDSHDRARVYMVYTSGGVSGNPVNYTTAGGAVAPVINISAEYAKNLIGNGTMNSPYQIEGIN